MGKLAQAWAQTWKWLGDVFHQDEDKATAEIIGNMGARGPFADELKAANVLSDDDDPDHRIPFGATRLQSLKRLKWIEHGAGWLAYKGENHLFTVGRPGSGKGARVIIPTLLTYRSSSIVIDPKGQNAAVTAHWRGQVDDAVFILNPYNVLPDHLNGLGDDVVNLAGYNPLDRINPASDNFVADVRSLAQALIVHQGGETHWADSARELVAALIMHVCLTCGSDRRNLGEVRALLSQPLVPPDDKGNLSGFLATMDAMTKSAFLPLAQKAGQFKEGTLEIKSIISTARTQLAFLDDPAICKCLSKSNFLFSLLKEHRITVYLVLPFNQLEAQGRWLRLLITSAIEELTAREVQPGDKRVLFMLDEFAQLGRLPAIERALALVRGYGVQLWPFVQDLPQLKSIYPDRWESFLATAGVVQFFAPNDETTAGYISKRAGQKLVRRKSSSTTRGSNSKSESEGTSEQMEPLIPAWDLYGLDPNHQVMFFEGLSSAVLSEARPYYAYEIDLQHAGPDPFHKPASEPAPAPAQAADPVTPAPAAPAPENSPPETPPPAESVIVLPTSRSRPRV